MAWIRVDQSLGNHRKTRHLARELGVERPTAIGHLVLLWSWALDNAPNGVLTGIDPQDIADAAGANRGSTTSSVSFLDALVTTGFVDKRGHGTGRRTHYQIHDWNEYAGKLLEERAANRERMRRARAGLRNEENEENETKENVLPLPCPPKRGTAPRQKNNKPLSGKYRDKVIHG